MSLIGWRRLHGESPAFRFYFLFLDKENMSRPIDVANVLHIERWLQLSGNKVFGRELCIEILAIFNLVVKMGTCSITSGESKANGVCFASKLSEIDAFFWAIPLLIAVSSPPKSFLPSTSNQGSLRPTTVKQ